MQHLLVILTFVIFSCECTPRSFYHPEMCKNEGFADCSFQFVDLENYNCQVYSTSECQKCNFSDWMTQPLKHPSSQASNTYTIDVTPYALRYTRIQPKLRTALNITLKNTNKDVDGYLLLVENSDAKVNICRIFDFRNSRTRNYTTFFYDCLNNLDYYGTHSFVLKVRSLPHNEEMWYTLLIPDASSIETDDICQWKPVIMVFNGGLQINSVEVKFSQSPKRLNISSYQVSLLSKTSDVSVQDTFVDATTEDEDLNVIFSNVDRGFYSIYIRPFSDTSLNCGATHPEFFIENKLIDKIIMSYIIAICLTGIIITVMVLLFIRWLFRPEAHQQVSCTCGKFIENFQCPKASSIILKLGPIKHIPVTLLVYSYDCKEHNKVVLKFKQFLEKPGRMMKVLTIYDKQESGPSSWLYSPYQNCDIVMIIVSEGVFNKCENVNNPPMREGYPCGDRLKTALAFLEAEISTDQKKYIQIRFEYSKTCCVPSFMQLRNWGKTFLIPQEMNRLLCEAYGKSPKISCLGVYPRMPGHDVLSFPEGMALNDDIEEMKQVLNQKSEFDGVYTDRVTLGNFQTRNNESHPPYERKEHTEYNPTPFQSSKQCCINYCYSNGHKCDGDNWSHLDLLQCHEPHNEEQCQLNSELSEQHIQGKNSTPDFLCKTEITNMDRALEDFEYIWSKPGPSLPFFSGIKT